MEASKSGLFGTSGIRGVVNVEFDPTTAMRLGMALADILKEGILVLGRDTRTSGEMISSAFTAGALAGGLEVVDLGVLPTPVLAYSTRSVGAVSGAMITASHNPPEFNGIKFFDRDGRAYGDALQDQIERVYGDGKFSRAEWDQLGHASSADYGAQYIDAVVRRVGLKRPWKVAVDFGSGAAHRLAFDLLRSLHCHVVSLNAQPDGFFPGRSPEPTPQSMSVLMATVRNMECDTGFAYDGDADRAFFVDESGGCVEGDVALAAFASYVVKKHGRGEVALPIDTSLTAQEAVEDNGGKVIWTKVGDANVAEVIVRRNAIFGGEPCGAWIHPDFHLSPDGVLSCVLLLKALEEEDVAAKEFFSRVNKYPMKRGKVVCRNEMKARVMKAIASVLPEALDEKAEITQIDGIRVQVKAGWVLIRPSGTEPVIRVTAEARSERLAEDLFVRSYNLCEHIVRERQI